MNLNGFVSNMFMKFQLRVKFDTKIVVDGKNRERTAFNRAAISKEYAVPEKSRNLAFIDVQKQQACIASR